MSATRSKAAFARPDGGPVLDRSPPLRAKSRRSRRSLWRPTHRPNSSPFRGISMIRKLFVCAFAFLGATTADAATYAIQAGRLIVDAAKPARGPSTLIVENGRISRIEDGFTAPAGATIVDERTRTVMPGMTDVHVHLTGTSGEPWYIGYTQKRSNPYSATVGLTHAAEMARAGFTTVRDLGGDTASVIAVRDAVTEGRFPGPRIKVSGDALSIIGGHGDYATGLPPELAAAVNQAEMNPTVC